MQNKRIIAVFILLVFCAALAIGSSAVFTVADVEASYSLISKEQKDNIEEIDELLDSFEGKNIMLLKNSDIMNALNKYTYLEVNNIVKKYPNCVNVNIIERKEMFAVFYNDNYFMADKNGFVIRQNADNGNNIDNLPNILLNVNGNCTIGEYINADNKELFTILLKIIENIDTYYKNINSDDGVRNIISAISIVNDLNIDIQMKEGLIISIKDAFNKPYEKLNLALNVYTTELEPEDKIRFNAKIIAYCDDNGNICDPVYSTSSRY